MSSGKAENQLGPCLKNDQRTLAGRTIGDLFYIMGEAMPDLNITEVLVWFVKTLQEFMEDEPIIPRNLLEGTVNQFIKHLPQSVAKQFQAA